jgi:N-acyl-L-homoserine lactone synthetase
VRATGGGRALSFSSATLHLLNIMRDFVEQHGIERVVMVTTLAVERLIVRS